RRKSSHCSAWAYAEVSIDCRSANAGDCGASQNRERCGRSKNDGRLASRCGSGCKAPGKVTCQRIAGEVLGPGCERGAIDGIGGEITGRCKGRNFAAYVVVDGTRYRSCPRPFQQEGRGADRCGIHRFTEGGVDRLVNGHIGSDIGRYEGGYRGPGRVRGCASRKTPGKVIYQRIACQVLG